MTTSTDGDDLASILITLVCSRDATRHQVVVTASSDVRWGDLRPHLTPHLPLPVDVYAGAVRVDDDAVLGSSPLIHGVVLTDRPRATSPSGLLEVAVAEGPDAGAVAAVTASTVRIGRAPTETVSVADPDLSRSHLLLEIAHGQVRATDLGSTNGTCVDDDRLAAGVPRDVRVGQRIMAGSSTFRLQTAARAEARMAVVAGRRQIHRAPREPVRLPEIELHLPSAPRGHGNDRLPWLMMLLPIPLAVVMALAMKSMMMLGFGLMSPVMMLGQYLHDRRTGRADGRRDQASYDRERHRVEGRREEAVEAAVTLRRRLAPDLAEMRAMASRGRLWPRRPTDGDHLWWRVGTGIVLVGVTVYDPDGEPDEATRGGCPVMVSLAEHRVVGLSGATALLRAAVDGLLGQLAVLHSPLFVHVVVVLADRATRPAWAWAGWLPHLSRDLADPATVLVVGEDDELIAHHLGDRSVAVEERLGHTAPPVRTVLILDGARRLVRHPVIAGVLAHGHEHGVTVVAVDERREHLPAECAVTVDLVSATQALLRGELSQGFTPDLPAAGWTLGIVDEITSCVDVTPTSEDAGPPSAARLLDLIQGATDAQALADGWASERRTTRALLGLGADGRVTIDLASDGPHALIGGTTGSGKSELLQTLIASLAVGNRPDEMVFVLVDYKGGAAFKDCARLPHTIGLVTDLDAHLTQRALTSLDAEIHRRERLLGSVGAKDLDDYQGMADVAPLPRLVLVIDEFRVLAEELPDFIDGLVRIAAVGRSLGIHLVLATQRPGGVVSTDIRANVNLRIALRVRDTADSDDVIDSPAAARISSRTPGRAILRSASSPTVTFQTARVGGHALGAAGSVTVWPVDPITGRALLPPPSETPAGATDLQCLVDATVEAARMADIPAVVSPWLAPLDGTCTIDGLAPTHRLLDRLDDEPVQVTTAHARLGLVDLPHLQRQDPLGWDLAGGHLAVVAGPRCGKTTALRTLCTDLAVRCTPDELHLYVLDPSGSLRALHDFPHVGAVIGRDDEGAGVRLITWLAEEIARRQALLAAEHHADLTEHRAAREAAGVAAESLPRILVAVDGWEAFAETYEAIENGRVNDLFLEVLRDGVAAGIHVVLTGGRSLLSSRVSATLQHRLCLRMADEMDLLMAGLRSDQVPADMPPGRALLLPDAQEVQLALLDADASGRAQAAAVQHGASSMPPPAGTPPRRFASLPDSVSLADLTGGADDPSPVLGLGGENLDVVGLSRDPTWGLAGLVCGPPGSGRTTTLLTLVGQLRDTSPILWLTGGALPDQGLPSGATHVEWDDTDAVWSHLEAHPDTVLVLDDLEQIVSDQVQDMAVEHLRRCRSSGGGLLAAGTTRDLEGAYRGVAHELRRRQTGLILQPDRHDGELLGARLPDVRRRVPGRGVLVVRGRAVEVQVAR
ncbi:FtsK/SpoIIIE domain-containing protein [Luteipulveratus mongoliensis]|uniref:FtsK/SpoIIIE domain-containing protein n=1 Tax=Luteipulveratus mongoliensis TaxID=571913 RepID=UPI000696A1A1|nr:FtsK/SpoIIIE domain-containing protein [Luteipulveratus mongoliensis]